MSAIITQGYGPAAGSVILQGYGLSGGPPGKAVPQIIMYTQGFKGLLLEDGVSYLLVDDNLALLTDQRPGPVITMRQ